LRSIVVDKYRESLSRHKLPSDLTKFIHEANGLLLMLLFSGTFDVHRRDWRALLRRMRLLRLGFKQQKMRVLRMK
jgi:hypothetical protein